MGIEITNTWAQATPSGQQAIKVYATLVSEAGDRLTHISSSDAEQAVIYQTYMKGGNASLHPVNGDLTLAPHQPMSMGPEGTYILLTGLKRDILPDGSVTLNLTFSRAGMIGITVPVEPSTATGAAP